MRSTYCCESWKMWIQTLQQSFILSFYRHDDISWKFKVGAPVAFMVHSCEISWSWRSGTRVICDLWKLIFDLSKRRIRWVGAGYRARVWEWSLGGSRERACTCNYNVYLSFSTQHRLILRQKRFDSCRNLTVSTTSWLILFRQCRSLVPPIDRDRSNGEDAWTEGKLYLYFAQSLFAHHFSCLAKQQNEHYNHTDFHHYDCAMIPSHPQGCIK